MSDYTEPNPLPPPLPVFNPVNWPQTFVPASAMGGGGGASSAGQNGQTSDSNGGDGVSSSITGTAVTYGGGGGGFIDYMPPGNDAGIWGTSTEFGKAESQRYK
jgi:hypothetical protein